VPAPQPSVCSKIAEDCSIKFSLCLRQPLLTNEIPLTVVRRWCHKLLGVASDDKVTRVLRCRQITDNQKCGAWHATVSSSITSETTRRDAAECSSPSAFHHHRCRVMFAAAGATYDREYVIGLHVEGNVTGGRVDRPAYSGSCGGVRCKNRRSTPAATSVINDCRWAQVGFFLSTSSCAASVTWTHTHTADWDDHTGRSDESPSITVSGRWPSDRHYHSNDVTIASSGRRASTIYRCPCVRSPVCLVCGGC